MNEQPARILLVDDEDGVRFTLGRLLTLGGYLVDLAATHAEAVEYFKKGGYGLVYLDIVLKGDNGIEVLKELKQLDATVPVIMLTGCPEVETAAEAVRLGAFDYITKPIRHDTLMSVTKLAINSKQLLDEKERNRANLDAIFKSVADSIVMVDVKGRLAQFNANAVQICGYSASLLGLNAAELDLGCGGICRKALQDVLSTKTAQELHRFECCTPKGDIRVVSFKGSPVMGCDGVVNGAVAVIRDETHVANLERSLQQREQFYGLIGSSAPMKSLYGLIEALTDVQTTVLINGESGTGKELVAAALHYGGNRKNKPFVKVNCSALSETLLESELFGHARGAFTGAIADKVGRFEKAHTGTIFLDEIGDISPAMQMRLLHVLQDMVIERVGDSTPIRIDVRVVAATNQDLAEMVRKGVFRQDLYYRLNVVRLVTPALRERPDDLPKLSGHFLVMFNGRFSRKVTGFTDDVMALFLRHDWPGNVRELEHTIEHAVILCKTDLISLADLPAELLQWHEQDVSHNPATHHEPMSVGPRLTLTEALAMADGNKSKAARLMGISRRTIYRHLGE